MARTMNPERNNTSIMVTKHLKSRIRAYAEKSTFRAGYESDAQVLERILAYYEQNHPVSDRSPKPTYVRNP